jgi:predicted DNA-binding transcriptional regulator YafY
MRRADRLFQLIQLLRARRGATGQQLADELRVSTRTVYRDIADLQGSGIPIRGEAGVGYRLERGFELPPLTFTHEELEGLVLGARIVSAWGDPELAAAVGSAIRRIEAVLPEGLRQVVLDTPLFVPDYPGRRYMAGEMATLRRAIGEHRVLDLTYVRADGERSERTVRPLGLYFWGKKWTLAAWCELRNDYRSFRPDRMERVELLQRGFDPEGEISLSEFLQRVERENPFGEDPPENGGPYSDAPSSDADSSDPADGSNPADGSTPADGSNPADGSSDCAGSK